MLLRGGSSPYQNPKLYCDVKCEVIVMQKKALVDVTVFFLNTRVMKLVIVSC